jgi:hypothetical protein
MHVQTAHSIRVGLCESKKCRAVHIQLYDDDGRLFATATLGVEYVPEITERMRDLAYEIAATKEA